MKCFAKSLLLSLSTIMFASSSLGQSCNPAGISQSGPITNSFNFIANPGPTNDTCWAHDERVVFVAGVTSCSSTSTTTAFAFNYAGLLSQEIVIPTSDTRTHFALDYLLDFDDPNNDPTYNRFSADIYDATTGTYLYHSGNYTGSMPDLLCTLRSSPTMYFSGTLAGHTIRIYFHGSSAYTDTHVRVYGIGFWGWN